MSQRKAAKVLGVDESTVRKDVRENPAPNAGKSRTTKAERGEPEPEAEIRTRAERKAGQLVAKEIKHGGSRFREGTLKRNGISKKQSHKWQKLGAVSQADFNGAIMYLTHTFQEIPDHWRERAKEAREIAEQPARTC
jgi:hypothetical protein